MSKSSVYLDYNATTPLSDTVFEQLPQLLSLWGNPSSIHLASRGPKQILREARRKLADYLKCSPLEIIFNSGASEGNNTVLKSVWSYYRPQNIYGNSVKNEFLISSVEHPSVLKAAQFLESEGAVVKLIPINRAGELDLEFIKNNISEKTALVSVMYANNEVGVVFPISQIARWAQEKGALVHCDAVQALGKTHFNIQELPVDYLTLSAHKFYSLKGLGVLYVRKNSPYVNLVHGGGQERARRGGTENILGLAAFDVMLNQLSLVTEKEQHVEQLRNYFEQKVKHKISKVYINCEKTKRLANTSSLIIEGVDGETLLVSLDLKGFAVSTGAACSSGNPEPSPVLLALGLTKAEAQNSLRVSLGWATSQEEIDLFIEELVSTVERLRALEAEEKIKGQSSSDAFAFSQKGFSL